MPEKSLLFIPDITGFTEFVDQTAVSHGEHIISELLELIIDADQLGLTVSEVEGDAVFFYKEGSIPTLFQLAEQARYTFIKFHQHLKEYESRRICNCGACTSAAKLSIKFIAHSGDLGFTTVKGNKKPFGSAVVLTHRLLKNNVPLDEYLLISGQLFDSIKNHDSDGFTNGACTYEKEGKIEYSFSDLSKYFKEVPEPKPLPIPQKIDDPISGSIKIEKSADFVYEMVSNLTLRHHWMKQAKEIKYDKSIVNRIGVRHRCLFEDGKFADFETITDRQNTGKLIYGERVQNVPFTKELSTFYIVEQIDEGQVKLTMEVHHIPKLPFGLLVAFFVKRKFRRDIGPILQEIKSFCLTYDWK